MDGMLNRKIRIASSPPRLKASLRSSRHLTPHAPTPRNRISRSGSDAGGGEVRGELADLAVDAGDDVLGLGLILGEGAHDLVDPGADLPHLGHAHAPARHPGRAQPDPGRVERLARVE